MPQADESNMPAEIRSREQLMTDLTLALAPASRERLLAVIRLHGLQALAERSGPLACDRLLAEARQLAWHEVQACGRFYLSRRDELCVLFDTPLDEAIRVLDTVTTALNRLDPTGDVTAEAGVALLPDEASHPIGALDRADRRILPGDYAGREQWLGARKSRREEHQHEPALEDPRGQGPSAEQRSSSIFRASFSSSRAFSNQTNGQCARARAAPRCIHVVVRTSAHARLHRVRSRERRDALSARLARVPLRGSRSERAAGARLLLSGVCGGRVRPGTVEQGSMTAALRELSSGLWAFVRSDPGSIRRLNTAGQWSTWQEMHRQPVRAERELKPLAGTRLERRSLRRRRSPGL